MCSVAFASDMRSRITSNMCCDAWSDICFDMCSDICFVMYSGYQICHLFRHMFWHAVTCFLLCVSTCVLNLARSLTFFGFCNSFWHAFWHSSDKRSDICSDMCPDMSPGMCSDICSDIRAGIKCGMRSDMCSKLSFRIMTHVLTFRHSVWHLSIHSDSLSGILPGILSDMFAGILSGILTNITLLGAILDILSGIHCCNPLTTQSSGSTALPRTFHSNQWKICGNSLALIIVTIVCCRTTCKKHNCNGNCGKRSLFKEILGRKWLGILNCVQEHRNDGCWNEKSTQPRPIQTWSSIGYVMCITVYKLLVSPAKRLLYSKQSHETMFCSHPAGKLNHVGVGNVFMQDNLSVDRTINEVCREIVNRHSFTHWPNLPVASSGRGLTLKNNFFFPLGTSIYTFFWNWVLDGYREQKEENQVSRQWPETRARFFALSACQCCGRGFVPTLYSFQTLPLVVQSTTQAAAGNHRISPDTQSNWDWMSMVLDDVHVRVQWRSI